MKPSRIWCALSIAATTLMVVACEKPYHQPEEKYVLVTANVNLPYWEEAQAGLNDISKTAGVKVDVEGPTTFAPNEELTAFQQAVGTHPSGIMVSVTIPNCLSSRSTTRSCRAFP